MLWLILLYIAAGAGVLLVIKRVIISKVMLICFSIHAYESKGVKLFDK
jgi:hypothetical protein